MLEIAGLYLQTSSVNSFEISITEAAIFEKSERISGGVDVPGQVLAQFGKSGKYGQHKRAGKALITGLHVRQQAAVTHWEGDRFRSLSLPCLGLALHFSITCQIEHTQYNHIHNPRSYCLFAKCHSSSDHGATVAFKGMPNFVYQQ